MLPEKTLLGSTTICRISQPQLYSTLPYNKLGEGQNNLKQKLINHLISKNYFNIITNLLSVKKSPTGLDVLLWAREIFSFHSIAPAPTRYSAATLHLALLKPRSVIY